MTPELIFSVVSVALLLAEFLDLPVRVLIVETVIVSMWFLVEGFDE